MTRLIYDTETCGFAGMPVTIQYQTITTSSPEVVESPICLYHIWREPIQKTLDLITEFMTYHHVGFNLVFDHFQLCKLYNVFLVFTKRFPHLANERPDPELMADCELEARDGPCLRPVSACDLMLLARKNKYQITMERKDIRIKRVPTVLAWDLAEHLDKTIKFDSVLFARASKKTGGRWKVYDAKLSNGRTDPNFKDVVLKFKAGGGLKHLVVSACPNLSKDVINFKDVNVDKKFLPWELEYAPFAAAFHHKHSRGKIKKGQRPWPQVIKHHIDHWLYNDQARKYAELDVVFTRALWEAFGKPEGGDVDSELAICVAAGRWKGYTIDVPYIQQLHDDAMKLIRSVPVAGKKVKEYILEVCSPVEQMSLKLVKTGKVVLEKIIEDPDWEGHPVVQRAKDVMEVRRLVDEVKLYRKLLIAGRLHFGVKVIGALSSRMSGDNKLNPQGIKAEAYVSKAFTFSSGANKLLTGDFDGFEITIADKVYDDELLHAELLAGEKIHTLFAMCLFPDKTKEEILKSKKTELDMYDMGKRGVFAMLFGGNANTLMTRLGITEERANAAERLWMTKYPGIARSRQSVVDRFAPMKQPGGLGTRVIWHDPDDSVFSLLGHQRFFTLENMICKALYDLANKPLKQWKNVEGRVVRRERQQTIGGAIMSALFAAAFAIQSAMVRAAANHEIQSSGAQITKNFQLAIWALQPVGIHDFVVQPCNIHDEILCPTAPTFVNRVFDIIGVQLEKHREIVPLLNIEFKEVATWADK